MNQSKHDYAGKTVFTGYTHFTPSCVFCHKNSFHKINEDEVQSRL